MIWDHTKKLREICVETFNWPLSYNKWSIELNNKTNCLAFALGLSISDCDFDELVYLNPEIPTPTFSEIFQKLLNELGLEWRNLDKSEDANPDEYVLQIYGFYKIKNFSGYSLDFHVIRRELDGTWVHKPDFKEAPCELDWSTFREEYPDNEIKGIFAVRKPQ